MKELKLSKLTYKPEMVFKKGKSLPVIYHGGKQAINQVDPKMFLNAKHEFYGKGFYATPSKFHAGTWGKVITKFKIDPNAKVLYVPCVAEQASPSIIKKLTGKKKLTMKVLKKVYDSTPKVLKGQVWAVNDKWAKVVNKYAKKNDVDVIIFGSPDQMKSGDYMAEVLIKNPKSVTSLGKTSLEFE